jgi:hypothetical protein
MKKWYFVPKESYHTKIGGIGKNHLLGHRIPLIIGEFQVYEDGEQPPESVLASLIKWIHIGGKYQMVLLEYNNHPDPYETDIAAILYVLGISFESSAAITGGAKPE